MNTFYVTTPIYYANSLPHVGHLYSTVFADCIIRYKRQRGFETFFLTGTDEHGINIERASARAGRTPKEHVDYIVGELKKFFASFDLDPAHGGYDIFMRTTEPFHYEGVSTFWRKLAGAKTPKGRDCIYKDWYEGWFCAPCGTFKTESEYIKPEREGDAPLCLIHEAPLDRVSEEIYFFRLSDFDEALLALYESRPDFIRPESRRNEVMSFVRSGLQDISISRMKSSVSWAIPVPGEPEQTIYIWLDALTNYITALGYGNAQQQQSLGSDALDKFWPGLHIIGKDILRQHAIYWPAFLMAAGVEQPRAVIAHGLWLDQFGRKVSKTLNNMIDVDLLHRHVTTDAMRYYMLREMPLGVDGRIGYESVIERTNSDLASGLGNLLSRTLTMINRYCDGAVPAATIPENSRLAAKRAGLDADEMALATTLEHARDQFILNFDDYLFSRAIEAVWGVIARVDKIISDAKPWELVKSEEQRPLLNAVLYRAAESLRWLTVMLHAVMPAATAEMWRQLGQSDDVSKYDPARLVWGGLQEGTRIGEVTPLFPRIDKTKTMSQINKELEERGTGTPATQAATPGSEAAAETKPQPPAQGATQAEAVPGGQATEGVVNFIGIEDFAKVEMRVGEVLTAERVPKSDKLLRFTIDVGEAQPRQVLAGIAQYYEPEKMVGRKVVVVTNLQPRKLRGFESQGMVLAASVGDEGRPVIATFAEEVPNGARLK